jgi:hypothetical protein
MPVTKITTSSASGNCFLDFHTFSGLWFVGGTGLVTGNGIFSGPLGGLPESFTWFGCVMDQFGFDIYIISNGSANLIGCELFSSVAGTPNAVNAVLFTSSSFGFVYGCNIHDTVSGGYQNASTACQVLNSIIAKCGTDGISQQPAAAGPFVMSNCTIDGNAGNGLVVLTQADLSASSVSNNIFSNHTGGGKAGFVVSAGTAVRNSAVAAFADYNTYYNNTTDVSGINYGPHDTHGGSDPYVNQLTEDYTLS